MGALFVGSLTTYSDTYSGSTKTLAAYYERRYSDTHRSKTQRQGERIGGHHGNGSLKQLSLRINWCQLVTSWQLLNE